MRSWDVEIELLSYTDGFDDAGFPVENQELASKLLANELPVNSSNFYGGAQAGFNIAAVFEIHAIEYEGQDDLRFDGEKYRVRRTRKADGYIELHCERFDTDHQ